MGVLGSILPVGGRLGASSVYASDRGDGLVLGPATADGAEKWSAFYGTGTGPDEPSVHHIQRKVKTLAGLSTSRTSWSGATPRAKSASPATATSRCGKSS